MQNNIMEFSSQKRSEVIRGKYKVITYATRKELIEKVINHGNSIYRAAIDLDINHSTAKVILKKFRRNGFILRRKGEKKSNQLKSSNIVVNGQKVESVSVINEYQQQAIQTIQTEPYFNNWSYLLNYQGNLIQYTPQYFWL